jgi:hypothetical protein
MGRKEERRTIGRYEYIVTQLPWEKWVTLSTRLARLLAPAAAAASANSGIVEAVGGIAALLDEKEVFFAAEVLGESSRVVIDDKAPTLTRKFQALHWDGEYSEFIQWLRFALEVNFSDFFAGLPSLLGKGQQGTPAKP